MTIFTFACVWCAMSKVKNPSIMIILVDFYHQRDESSCTWFFTSLFHISYSALDKALKIMFTRYYPLANALKGIFAEY